MLAHKLQVEIPQDHRLSLDLPESFPAGPAEVIVLATAREPRKIVRAAGVLASEEAVPEGDPIADILQELRAERAESIERFAADLGRDEQ